MKKNTKTETVTTREIARLQNARILEDSTGRVYFVGDADIDADGANGQNGRRPAYTPADDGLDALRNAKTASGRFVGVVTDKDGKPVVQGKDDPFPGAYVSATSLHLLAKGKPLAEGDPRRYVDSATVPFIVVPPAIIRGVAGIVLGCRAKITHERTGKTCEAVVADVGPSFKIGELSIAAAERIGIPSNARHGGESAFCVLYELWPGVAAVVDGVKFPLQPSRV